jgi:UDP-N-acetylmuramate--alanine ligase
MSALARIVAWQGKVVSGTDRSDSHRLAQMREEGIRAEVGHDPRAIRDAEVLVVTTAIEEDNVELLEARRLGLPVLHRAELLAAIVAEKRAVAVTGTHGKSTTTAMLGHILEAAGMDPLVIVGGDVAKWGGNVRFGRGPWTVFEACESDGTLRLYDGCSQIITSLEREHMDYHKTFAALCQAIASFAASADAKGFVVFFADSKALREAATAASAHKVGYGLHKGQYLVRDIRPIGEKGLSFELQGPSATVAMHLPLCGAHNALNAAAAVAATVQIGPDMDLAANALAVFRGVGRRFETLGQLGSSQVIDDYAHHPSEVRATLKAAKEHLGKPILAIFQPHLYSRTRDLMNEFATAFADADEVIITDIYAARERPEPGITGRLLASRVAEQRPGRPTHFISAFDDIVQFVRTQYCNGWTIMVIGAGDIRKVGEKLVRKEP